MKLKILSETVMDNAFDDFYSHYEDKTETGDGYYEIKTSLEDFTKFMGQRNWDIITRGNINYPAEKFVTMGNGNYPDHIGILEVENGIQVGEADGFS